MTFNSTQNRYDEFQEEAVLATVEDFSANPAGRFLLVIPTGGGKTFTAVKTINKLFESGVLDSEKDRVMWTAHQQELIKQADNTFDKFKELYPENPCFKDCLDFKMISQASSHLANNKQVRLVVIDEAHHGAASSYLPLFEDPSVGVLGLTATPTRHDGKPLEFERESYSIGFPDLVEMGVILKPEVIEVKGGSFEVDSLNPTKGQLGIFNTRARNRKIIDAILQNPDRFKKVVIYTGTKEHAEALCDQLQESALSGHYQSISFVFGGRNGRNEDREEFLNKEKAWERSILVNCGILSEGYDDPSINTIIMATPTHSKLVYMQAIGRGVRHNPSDELKKAFILEVHDELPNIRYRIDNRWLYADVSDSLEPDVIDREYADEEGFVDLLRNTYKEYGVEPDNRVFPEYQDGARYGLLLFKVFKGTGEFTHQPILVDKSNRTHVSNFFNFVSERMRSFETRQINALQILKMARINAIQLEDRQLQQRVFDAMRNSIREDALVKKNAPWVTFVAFRLKRNRSFLVGDLQEFVDSLVNKEEITSAILEKAYPESGVLVRLPLPLCGFFGRFMTKQEFLMLNNILEKLSNLKEENSDFDHRQKVRELMDSQVIPLEVSHAQNLTTIVRESIDYFRNLK